MGLFVKGCGGFLGMGWYGYGEWFMCIGRNVRIDVYSHVCIWIEFLIFCLAGCYVMGE